MWTGALGFQILKAARAGDSGGIFSSDGWKVDRQNFQNKSLAVKILGAEVPNVVCLAFLSENNMGLIFCLRILLLKNI